MTGYVEVDPVGPTSNGDPGGDDAITDSWSRRFARPAHRGAGVAVIEVDCYLRQRVADPDDPESEVGPVELIKQTGYTLCGDVQDVGGTELYCDYTYEVVATATPEKPLTHEDTRRVCAEVDPAGFTWSGLPRSERPCRLQVDEDNQLASCLEHSTTGLVRLASDWLCDRGHHWRFLTRYDVDQDETPAMVNLARLVEVLGSVITNEYYTGDKYPFVIRRWVDDDTLEPLTMAYVPDTEGEVPGARGTYSYPNYVVTGPDGTEYARFAVPLQRDI